MQNLDFQSKMVGRESELTELQAYLDKAGDGEGSTVFISGEAGIGKTRLVNELKQVAQEREFQILSGNSMYESLTPFMPLMEALKAGGLEFLFAEEAPRVEAVYLVAHSGLLVKEVVRRETKLDPDLFSSVLTTLSEFASQSLSNLLGEQKEGTLNSLGFENYRILIKSRKNTNLVVIISGRENEFLINDMKEIFRKTDERYGKILENWDGDEKKVADIEELLKPLITSGKYDGIYYGKEDPKIRRNLLFENVSMGLIRYSKATPTLMCIEDLQWADPSSLALIDYISRKTRKSGLFVVGTFRPEEITTVDGKSHPLKGTMQLMDREDLYEKMELKRLPEGSMDEFLFALLGKSDFTIEFKNRIYQETEGNPLFVIQLIKYMVDERIILEDKGKWKLTKDIKDFEIPSKIYNVIERRLNRLEKEERRVLDYASIIGETFTSSILTYALDTNRTQMLEQLKGLEHTHRLIHSHDGKFKFDHAKIKEVLYTEIPKELRMGYHSIIASSIEDLNKDNLDEVIGDLAFHYYRCRNREKALPYLIKTAEKAKKDYSNEEAVMFYNQALELEEDTQKRMEIFRGLGDVHFLIGDHEKSVKSYKTAFELAELALILEKTSKERHEKVEDFKNIKETIEMHDLPEDLKLKGNHCIDEAIRKISMTVEELRYPLDGKEEMYHELIFQIRKAKQNLKATSLIDISEWNNPIMQQFVRFQENFLKTNEGSSIERIFILPDRELNKPEIIEIMDQMVKVGIDVYYATVEAVPRKNLMDFAIFDHNITVTLLKEAWKESPDGTLSYNPNDLELYTKVWEDLMKLSKKYPS